MSILLLSYLMRNVLIEINWKVLVMRVLPLPVFFMKIMRG